MGSSSSVRAARDLCVDGGWNGAGQVGGFSGIEAADEVGDVFVSSAAQQAGGDGTAIAAFAVNDEQLVRVEFGGAGLQLAQRDPLRVFDHAAVSLGYFADIEDGDEFGLTGAEVGEILRGDLRDRVEG